MSFEVFSWLVVALLIFNAGLLAWVCLSVKRARAEREPLEPVVREELRVGREDADRAAREMREEIARAQHASAERLGDALYRIGQSRTSPGI